MTTLSPPAETISTISAERRLLAQISLAHWVSHVHIMVVPALLPLLPGHFGRSFLEIGAALTVFNLVSLIVQGPMGLVCDRFGHRRVLTAGLVLGGSSFLMLAVMPSYPMLIVAMATAGLANGVYHPADYALLARGVDGARMGRAFSLHTFAGYLGTAMAPVLLLGTAALLGVPAAFTLAGLAGLLAALPVGSAARRLSRPRRPRRPATPRRARPGAASSPARWCRSWPCSCC